MSPDRSAKAWQQHLAISMESICLRHRATNTPTSIEPPISAPRIAALDTSLRESASRSRGVNHECELPARRHARNRFASTPAASLASLAACFDSLGRPPSAVSTESGPSDPMSSTRQPIKRPVRADPAAMDAVHPRAWKRTSRITSFRTSAETVMTSPQIGFSTLIVTAGGSKVPTRRRFRKCLSRTSLYTGSPLI